MKVINCYDASGPLSTVLLPTLAAFCFTSFQTRFGHDVKEVINPAQFSLLRMTNPKTALLKFSTIHVHFLNEHNHKTAVTQLESSQLQCRLVLPSEISLRLGNWLGRSIEIVTWLQGVLPKSFNYF
jgi:hypothetical protein